MTITENELKAAFASESELNKFINKIEKDVFKYLAELRAAGKEKEAADFLKEILKI